MAVYSTNGRLFDLGIMLAAGVLGFIMRKTGIPLAPLTISFLLSTMIEVYFRRSIQLGGGDFSILFHSGISQALSITIAISLIFMIFMTIRRITKRTGDKNIAG
jgi:putative tricarboxylic transport membrane protein